MRLERLRSYAGRPPVATERLSVLPDGRLRPASPSKPDQDRPARVQAGPRLQGAATVRATL
jgi:hypothetical protein